MRGTEKIQPVAIIVLNSNDKILTQFFWPPDKLLGTVKQWFVEDRRQGRARFHRVR